MRFTHGIAFTPTNTDLGLCIVSPESARAQLLADPGHIRDILHRGAEKARAKAVVTLDLVRDRAGLKY